MKGIVTKSTGMWYEIFINEEAITIDARLKGTFRLVENKDTNPIAVGDEVNVEREGSDWVISEIDERKNYIIRQSPKHKYKRHIVASNLDQAIVVASISQPRTSNGFIDRFLVTAEAYNIPSIIIFNKTDLYSVKDKIKLEDWTNTYTEAGYEVLQTSATEDIGIDKLSNAIKDKTTLLSGHSGVGKSTLMNKIDSSLDLRTNVISKKHQKGMHTTTFSELFFIAKLNAGIIDTPGIKEFGVLHIEEHELKNFFKEMVPYLNQCKFHDCLHINEPKCEVINQLENGNISEWRYKNYLNILDDIKNQMKSWEMNK